MAENETVDSSGLTFPIENLHEALIINIFQYLPVKDLKSLFLTNKYLNGLIVSSLSLMSRFLLKFFLRKKDYSFLLNSSRKFQRLKVVGPNFIFSNTHCSIEKSLLLFLPMVKIGLFEIEFKDCNFFKSELLNIL